MGIFLGVLLGGGEEKIIFLESRLVVSNREVMKKVRMAELEWKM